MNIDNYIRKSYVPGIASPDAIMLQGRIREFIVALLLHCDIKAHNEVAKKVIVDFVEEFFNDLPKEVFFETEEVKP